jgi:hypothetical protein
LSPAIVTWTNPGGGDWETVGNWSTGALPGPGDDVVIDLPGVTVTHSLGTDVVNRLTSQDALAISGGSLTALRASSVNNTLGLTGGTLASGETLAVGGRFTWAGGTLAGSGHTRANGGLTISGTFSRTLDRATLDNAGTATWVGGNILGSNGGTVNNLAGATFDAQTDAGFLNLIVGAGPTFNNAGTFSKSAGTGTTTFEAAFNNSGTVNADSGTLRLVGGGADSGIMSVRSPGALEFGGGTHNLGPTSRVSGPFGEVRFSGGTTSIAGAYNAGLTTVAAGTVNFLSNATTIRATLSGGTLTGPGDVTVAGLMTWTGGAMTGSGRTVANGGMEISGPAGKTLDGRALDNAGTATWTTASPSGGITTRNGAVFNNLAGATFIAQLEASAGFGDSTSVFNNRGTFILTWPGPTTSTASPTSSPWVRSTSSGTPAPALRPSPRPHSRFRAA